MISGLLCLRYITSVPEVGALDVRTIGFVSELACRSTVDEEVEISVHHQFRIAGI
jgi:hypothetical protein